MAAAMAVLLCGASIASAQTPRAETKLNIEISSAGASVFSALVPEIAAAGRLGLKPVPKVTSPSEATKKFCSGMGGDTPDILLTTRRLRSSTVAQCGKNGVEHIAQVVLGRSALVLAVRSDSPLANTKLTTRQVYWALARDVPDNDEFRRNSAIRWSDVDRTLPQTDIRFHVPPRDDGARPLFNAHFMEAGCRHEALIKSIFNAEQRSARCITTRLERVREIPTSRVVEALLEAPPGTVGVISDADLEKSEGKLVGLVVDGVAPDHDAIVDGEYGSTETYYLYAKRGRVLRAGEKALDLAVDRIILAMAQESVVGPTGSASRLGLIPLSDASRDAQRRLFAPPAFGDSVSAFGNLIGSVAGFVAGGARDLVDIVSNAWSPGGADDEEVSEFAALMDIAGYKIKEVQTSISIIPAAGMTFGIARSMTEADKDYLERQLRLDERKRRGVVASAQRAIIRSILDLSETYGYEMSKVEIEFVPLPSAKFVMEPEDAPIGLESSLILRSIERLSNRLSELMR
jgi:phosphate transport system substrate-binding protein